MPLLSPPRRRWAAALALILALVVALGWAVRSGQNTLARRLSGLDGAEWIWAPVGKLEQAPAAFYLVRDFELATPPERARLLVSADEEYVLTLNARVVGTGSWRPGPRRPGPGGGATALDAYEVGPLLQPGGNRLVAEVRSGRAAGGLLLRLESYGDGAGEAGDESGAGRPLVVSDGSWRIVRAFHPGLARGWLPVAPPGVSEPVLSLGLAPIGRWGRPVAGSPRPLLADLTGAPLRPARLAPGLVGGERLAPQALFDWGRERTGYLMLEIAPDERRRVGLMFPAAGAAPPDPLAGPGVPGTPVTPVIPVIVPPGAREWLDPQPRRLRFVRVLGLPGLTGARLLPLAEEAAADVILEEAEGERRGVLGLEPPPLRTPVEDEVWRELQRVPGVAGRKEL